MELTCEHSLATAVQNQVHWLQVQMPTSNLHDSTPWKVREGLHQCLQVGHVPAWEHSSAVLQLGYIYKNLSSIAKWR